MPILCRKNAEKATGKTGCGKRIGMARLRACMMYRVSVRMNRPVASAAAIPAQPAGREENVAAVTAQPLAALPPYGCGVPFTGGERHAGWHYLRHKFIGARPPSLSFRGAKRRGNLLQPVTFSPRPTCYSTWYCEIATSAAPPRNDKSGSFRIPFQISVYYVLRAVY